MPERLKWDQAGQKEYQTGVDRGVLYPYAAGKYTNGIAWNGLTGVTESPSGAEATALYADNIKYISLTSAEEFGGTIESYMYPDEFKACNGETELAAGITVSQQNRTPFGLAYRTILGNDIDGDEHGYIIHLVYEARVTPSEKAFATKNDSPEAITFSWEFTTTPVDIATKIAGKELKPTAHLEIDSTKVSPKALAAIEDALYGSTTAEAKLLTPDEIIEIINNNPGE